MALCATVAVEMAYTILSRPSLFLAEKRRSDVANHSHHSDNTFDDTMNDDDNAPSSSVSKDIEVTSFDEDGCSDDDASQQQYTRSLLWQVGLSSLMVLFLMIFSILYLFMAYRSSSLSLSIFFVSPLDRAFFNSVVFAPLLTKSA